MFTDKLTRREFVQAMAVTAFAFPAIMTEADTFEAKAKKLNTKSRGIYVSIRDDVLMTGGYASVAEGLRETSINGVELGVGRDYTVCALTPTTERPRLHLDNDDDVSRLAEQIAVNNIRVPAFLIGNNFNTPKLEEEVAWAVRIIQVAGRLGVPAIRIDAIMENAENMPTEEREEIFARTAKLILSRTEGIPVDLGIENHGVQGNDPVFLLGLLKRVGSKRLGINMDTGNFYWAGYPLDTVYDILKQLAPYTKHTHIKNIRYPDQMRNVKREAGYEYGKYVCPIPEGDIDVAKVVGYLKKVGYKRDLCIEDESLGRYDQATRRATIVATAQYLQKCI